MGKLGLFFLAASIGPAIAGSGSWLLYPAAIVVLVVGALFGGSVLCRQWEFAADRRGSALLGSTTPLRALLEQAVGDRDRPSGLRARLADYCYPWPTARQRLNALDVAPSDRSIDE